MFDNIFAAIEKWMRELLSGMVESNLSTMFTAVNQQTSEIAAQVGQTPQGWNSSIFSMIRNISDSVVIPIAGIIITLILCYELISMLTERNNLHDVDTWMFFKYFVKMWIAVYLVSHTFDIAMAVFDIGQSVVNSSSGIIRGNTAIDISSLSMQMQAAMATMAIGELVTLALETLVVSWCLKILSVVITVIMYGRMIEIYLYTSLAPIPFATMSNREWGHVGTNYFRGLFALAFQAFLMMVCVAIYAALIGSIRVSSDIHSALFGTMAYTVILCFPGAQIDMERKVRYPSVRNPRELVEQFYTVLDSMDDAVLVEPVMAAEDFAEYQQEIPGVFFFLGVQEPSGTAPLHSSHFDFDERVLLTGVETFKRILEGASSCTKKK